MSWAIGRARALEDPIAAKLEVLDKLRSLASLEDAEDVVIPVLINAVMLVESHRAVRGQITFLEDLSRAVDGLIAALNEADIDAASCVILPQKFPPK